MRDFSNNRPRMRNFQPDRLATAQRQFALHKVNCLYSVGAFINRQNTGVAHMLRCSGAFNKAHAAVHLHIQRRDLIGDVGGKGFGDRGE